MIDDHDLEPGLIERLATLDDRLRQGNISTELIEEELATLEADAELAALAGCVKVLEQRWPRTPVAGAGVSQNEPLGAIHPAMRWSFSSGGDEARLGRFRIKGELGRGGFGVVYLAEDTVLERDVALKVPQFSRGADCKVRERFQREARAAATLNHPNICPVYDFGEVDGVPYLTMAFIDGMPLHGMLVEPKSIEGDRNSVALVRTVALAIDHAHALGVVHRDLKPGNIMLDRRGEPIVVDFGLARRPLAEDITLTQQGMVLGSLAYISPEQALGTPDEVGPPSDIYSLGVILYELLTGQLPYRGPRSKVLAHILSPEAVELHEHRPDLDPSLRVICAKALAKAPAERYASMCQFAAALQEYLDGNRSVADIGTAPHSRIIRQRIGLLVIGLILAMLGSAFAGLIVVKLQTKDGTLIVEVNEPGAKVTVLDEQGAVKVVRASDGGTLNLSLDPGKHRLKVEKEGFSLFAKEFSIATGESESIKAMLVPPTPLVANASSQASQGSIPAPPGLIAWWSGDGHAQDYAGASHGALMNGVSFAPGLVGQAFSLDGVDDYVRVQHRDVLNPKGVITIEGWVCCDHVNKWQKIIGKWNMAMHDCSYSLQKSIGTGKLAFSLTQANYLDLGQIVTRRPIRPATWTHFAATFDRQMRLYIDGVLEAEKDVGSDRFIHSGTSDVTIGTNEAYTGLDQFFAGLIDELCLYDRSLTDGEIRAIYDAGAAGKIKPRGPVRGPAR